MSLIFPSSDFGGLTDMAAQARRLADALDRLAANGGVPTPADLARAPVLDCWMPTTRLTPALIGLVTGHPRIADDRGTVTSELFALDTAAGWARTWSRFYRLGDAAPAGFREAAMSASDKNKDGAPWWESVARTASTGGLAALDARTRAKADNGFDPGGDAASDDADDDGAYAFRKSRTPSDAIADEALAAALPRDIMRRLIRREPVAVVITAPGADWVEPLTDAVRRWPSLC